MDKIHSRSPFYLEVNAGEPTPAPQTIPIACGGVHNVATDVGVVTYQVETPVSCVFGLFPITGSHLVSIEMKGNWYFLASLKHYLNWKVRPNCGFVMSPW